MKLEDQVCTLQSAKRLRELGWAQNSLFYWTGRDSDISSFSVEMKPYASNVYSAYTASELGEMLPYYLVNKGELSVNKNYVRDYKNGWNCSYQKTVNCSKELPVIYNPNQTECMAKMLIYLTENALIAPNV